MPIWLQMNAHSGVPLYVQLVEQIQRAVQVGILRPGDSLPPMRQLAAELHLALNTIVKAYSELESLGIIETRGGAGTIVSTSVANVLRPQAIEQVRQRLHALTSDAATLAVDEQELRDWFEAELSQIYHPSVRNAESIIIPETEKK
jgi:GntR family transcriptional regulator